MEHVPGHPDYSVTKDGRVWSHIGKGRWLKPAMGGHGVGHPGVSLRGGGKRKTRKIHQLVLETYVGSRPDGMGCRHLDGDPMNNNLDNLCWGTQSENMQDTIQHGTSSAKLVIGDIGVIVHLYSTGLFSQTKLAEMYNVCQSTINNILLRKTWRCVWAVT